MKVRKSGEDYLEAMLILKERFGYIRSVDIAEELGVKKPSVTYATKRLKESGHITMDEDNLITLTEAGMAIATSIYERHKLLTQLFINLGVDEQVAREDACKIEHDLSKETFEAIRRYFESLGNK
ncbi:MAG: metal-dependent transcriptional regulator [Clostridiales bacterium]|nr:metal-dependent transcriptional regulator [Clostridiales bacterium]